MRRSIEYCRWSASWWEGQAFLCVHATPPHVAECIAAYAFEQAHDEREHESKWAGKWGSIQQHAVLVLDKFLSDHEDKDKGDDQETLNITIEDDGDDSDVEDTDDWLGTQYL